MGTPRAPPVRVRVVLPDDTVQRVPVATKATARDLVAHIQTRRDRSAAAGLLEKAQNQEVPVGVECSAPKVELVLVRRGLVLREDQPLLSDVNVRDGDILEWRVADEAATSAISRELDQHATEWDEPETGSSEEGRCSSLSSNGKGIASDASQKDLSTRPQRRRHSMSVPVQRRALPSGQQQRAARVSSARKDDALARLVPRDFLLRAAFEYLDRLSTVQSLSRQLLMQVRDIYSRLGPQPIATLFPVVHALATQTSELLGSETTKMGETPSLSVRWLYPLISRSVQGTELPVVMQGYVDVAEWVALWRNQRRVYACLCDGGKLLLFANQKHSEEFVFELAMRGNESTVLEPSEEPEHKRVLKENAPHTTIDLVTSQWNVRKGETTQAEPGNSNPAPRHAFALFDLQGKLRLIMDVSTQRQADQWIAAIKAQLRQSKLLNAAVAQVPPNVNSCGFDRARASNLTVPLRLLHGHVDSLTHGQARIERVKSWTLTQALKDLRRDRLEINGVVYSGLCVEAIVGALLMEITRLAPALTPADAMQFTRLLLVTSSRTQGGGDILDAMRLAVTPARGNSVEQYCFCPIESTQISPIRIDISLGDPGPVPSKNSAQCSEVVASIRMDMRYRVFTDTEIGNNGVENGDSLQDDAKAREAAKELVLTGIYQRQLMCCAEHWNRLDGSVAIFVDVE